MLRLLPVGLMRLIFGHGEQDGLPLCCASDQLTGRFPVDDPPHPGYRPVGFRGRLGVPAEVAVEGSRPPGAAAPHTVRS